MNRSLSCFLLLLVCVVHRLSAIILVGGDNGANLTDPGTGAPWDEVARVTNSSGTHVTSGSAVHLGGGYMLTANHVGLGQGYVSFDGSSTYAIAPGSTVQVMSGSDVVDLKVFQLTSNPGTFGVNLLPEAEKGSEFTFGTATHIGWGVGHDPLDAGNPWEWGSGATSQKRWGLNDFTSAGMESYTAGLDYSFEALRTSLDFDATANEAAATYFDSGSGLFSHDVSGNWFLAGTIVTVDTLGSSTFASDGSQDFNYSVRIAEYADEVSSLLTDPIPVPENSFAFGLALLASLMVSSRRRVGARSGTRGCRRSL